MKHFWKFDLAVNQFVSVSIYEMLFKAKTVRFIIQDRRLQNEISQDNAILNPVQGKVLSGWLIQKNDVTLLLQKAKQENTALFLRIDEHGVLRPHWS